MSLYKKSPDGWEKKFVREGFTSWTTSCPGRKTGRSMVYVGFKDGVWQVQLQHGWDDYIPIEMSGNIKVFDTLEEALDCSHAAMKRFNYDPMAREITHRLIRKKL